MKAIPRAWGGVLYKDKKQGRSSLLFILFRRFFLFRRFTIFRRFAIFRRFTLFRRFFPFRHCAERSDKAIRERMRKNRLDCFGNSLAMTHTFRIASA